MLIYTFMHILSFDCSLVSILSIFYAMFLQISAQLTYVDSINDDMQRHKILVYLR